jgi:hypothetical protein
MARRRQPDGRPGRTVARREATHLRNTRPLRSLRPPCPSISDSPSSICSARIPCSAACRRRPARTNTTTSTSSCSCGRPAAEHARSLEGGCRDVRSWGISCSGASVWRLYRSHFIEWRLRSMQDEGSDLPPEASGGNSGWSCSSRGASWRSSATPRPRPTVCSARPAGAAKGGPCRADSREGPRRLPIFPSGAAVQSQPQVSCDGKRSPFLSDRLPLVAKLC